MSEKEPLSPRVIELSPEDEERFAGVADAVAETVESLEMFVSPGYPFALHPGSFAEAEEFVKDEKRMPDILLLFALRALKMRAVNLELVKEEGDERWFRTSKSGVLLGTDGVDWWLGIVPAVVETELEELPVIAKTRKATAKRAKKAVVTSKLPQKRSGKKAGGRRKDNYLVSQAGLICLMSVARAAFLAQL